MPEHRMTRPLTTRAPGLRSRIRLHVLCKGGPCCFARCGRGTLWALLTSDLGHACARAFRQQVGSQGAKWLIYFYPCFVRSSMAHLFSTRFRLPPFRLEHRRLFVCFCGLHGVPVEALCELCMLLAMGSAWAFSSGELHRVRVQDLH